jgi:hypothetical protein
LNPEINGEGCLEDIHPSSVVLLEALFGGGGGNFRLAVVVFSVVHGDAEEHRY